MVSYQHRGPGAVEVLPPGNYLEADVGCVAHGPFEGAGSRKLGQAVQTQEAEGEGGSDAVEGAEAEGAVGGEGAAVEG